MVLPWKNTLVHPTRESPKAHQIFKREALASQERQEKPFANEEILLEKIFPGPHVFGILKAQKRQHLMERPMDLSYTRGTVTKQAHVSIPDGLFEEEYGRSGFFGGYAHLYRKHPPVNWIKIEGPLKPRSFQLQELREENKNDYLANRKKVLYNQDVSLSFCQLGSLMSHYFRNADGDDLIFVHRGKGRLHSDFGSMDYEEGDYLVVPKGTVYLLEPTENSKFLIIESKSQLKLPDKGMLGHHALFDPSVISIPEIKEVPQVMEKDKSFKLVIKRDDELTHVYYPNCPIATAGWKGNCFLWKINVRDIRPVHSERYHLPPSAHTTFVGTNFVVCSFLPRPLETGDKTALKVPFYHSNIDFDEVLFYHSGDFFSRSDIRPGMITLHPQGIHHGPHEKAIEKSKDLERTDEIAVMLDAKNSLKMTDFAKQIESQNYSQSWRN